MTMHLEFTVPGPPVPKARPRVTVTGRGTFTPKKTKDYQELVAMAAMVAYKKSTEPFPWPLDAGYRVDCVFYFKGIPTKDLDNLAKSIFDALEGVLYTNDRQIMEAHLYKRLKAAEDKAVVRIWVIPFHDQT